MICVTLGRGRHRTLLEEWQQAAEAGVPLVELRIDCLRRDPDLPRILATRHTPLVFTVRRGTDGGMWRREEDKRLKLIREAIIREVEYVDLEVDVAKQVPRFGKTKRIISYHNFQKVPENLGEILEQARNADPDIIKFAVMTKTVEQASAVLKAAAESAVPTVGIAMGPLGFFTRVLGRKFGAPLTYAGFNPERMFAPGMPNYFDLLRDYHYEQIDKNSNIYAVIGDPVGHSLSPAIHNEAFRSLGLNNVYVPLQIPAASLKTDLEALSWLNIQGYSVTIPHKEQILPLLQQADGAVDRIGSCNTVIQRDGSWIGHNTDYHAAMGVLEDALGGRTDEQISPLMDRQVLILGAGGVARTIAFGLVRRGAVVTLTNRTEERAEQVASGVGCRYITWAHRASTPCDILINCTPVGMYPNVDETPAPPAAFRPGMIVFDTIYHPENTMFLKIARERDCKIVTGVDMFVRQAALQFRLFTGQDAPVQVMRDTVKRKLSPARE